MGTCNHGKRIRLVGFGSSSQGGVGVLTTANLLRRYFFIEESCIRAMAAWFLTVRRYEDKICLGYLVWSHAERANELWCRLRELRGGHHRANIEPMLHSVGGDLARAPDESAFFAGITEVLSDLSNAYKDHLHAADRSANAMEFRLLRRLDADLTEEIDTLRGVSTAEPTESDRAWIARVRQLLAAAGGVSGLNRITPLESVPTMMTTHNRSETLMFDSRIRLGTLMEHDLHEQLDFEQRRVEEFKVYFNEFYAAALLATVITDARQGEVPWEFVFDMSHHFWDEVRHAEFGMIRLQELGVEPSVVDLRLFTVAERMPLLHRLCYLTLGLEVYFMPRKRPRVQRFDDAGDDRSQLFADVDWSDETNHVRYGNKWVTHFLKDDARSIKDLQAEIAESTRDLEGAFPKDQMAPF